MDKQRASAILLVKLELQAMNRFDRLHRIQTLDPLHENEQICHWLAGYEFPWDVTRALEVALFRTFCVPSISKLLDRTGEFQHRTQKRYDDTGILVAHLLKWGYSSEQGRAAIERMNQIHGHFPIGNPDYLYVLSTFVYDPIRWIDRFGWRSLSHTEKLAWFYFWRSVGEQMQIQAIPRDYDAFERYNQEYERQHFRYCDANRRVGEATLNMVLGWFPAVIRPAIKPSVYALLDDRMLEAFGFPKPQPQLRQSVEALLQWRGRVLRYFPARHQPHFYGDVQHQSYPQGHSLADLGPPHLLAALNRQQISDQGG